MLSIENMLEKVWLFLNIKIDRNCSSGILIFESFLLSHYIHVVLCTQHLIVFYGSLTIWFMCEMYRERWSIHNIVTLMFKILHFILIDS